jgi:hypothetical protein
MRCRNAKLPRRLRLPTRARKLHETSDVFAFYVRLVELGSRSRPLLLRYRKEGRVVEEQVFARAQELTPPRTVGIAPTAAEYTVEVIRDMARFNSIAAEWDRLVNESGIDRVFLSHAWFRTWWEAFGESNKLHVITIRSGGQLVATVPMMRTRASIYGLKVDALHAIYNHHTPRYDFIVASGHCPRVYELIWRELSTQEGCDLIVLAQIPDGAHTVPAIERIAKQQGWLAGQWIAPVSPFISLNCDYEKFFNGLGASSRFNLTKRYSRLRRMAPVDVEVVTQRECCGRVLHPFRETPSGSRTVAADVLAPRRQADFLQLSSAKPEEVVCGKDRLRPGVSRFLARQHASEFDSERRLRQRHRGV